MTPRRDEHFEQPKGGCLVDAGTAAVRTSGLARIETASGHSTLEETLVPTDTPIPVTKIRPTVGRIVLCRDKRIRNGEAFPGIVTRVFDGGADYHPLVNVTVFADGREGDPTANVEFATQQRFSQNLYDPGFEPHDLCWCEWVPYQMGKTT